MQIQRLPPGSTSRTARVMLQLAQEAKGNYQIRQLAEQITRGVAGRDQLSEVLAIYKWVCARTRYTSDPHNIELVRDPIAALKSRALDCDDSATLIGSLCLALGRPIRMVTVGFTSPRGPHSHVYVECQVGHRWIALDPVAAARTRRMLGDVKAAKVFY